MTEMEPTDNSFELFVDQQVFVDAVRGNERVEEFSALTEVTTFEQRGENLYLEGNVLFTAYLAEAHRVDQPTDDVESEMEVEHLQHRMPFDILLPMGAQSTGLLSVTVKVPDATLDIIGPGWIHIRAVLEVCGLSPVGGYVAHCGAQEAAVPATPVFVERMTDVSDAESALLQTEIDPMADQTVEIPRVVEASPSNAGEPLCLDDLLEPFVVPEVASEALPQPDELAAFAARAAARESSLTSAGWKEQLETADRALYGTPVAHPFKTGRPPGAEQPTEFAVDQVHESAPKAAPEVPSNTARAQSASPTNSAPMVATNDFRDSLETDDLHFHFEHLQLPPEAPLAPNNEAYLELADDVVAKEKQGGSASPSTIPTQPMETPMPAPRLAEVASAPQPPEEVTEEALQEVQTSYKAVLEEEVQMSAAQWFWKSLNIPAGESRFTMKFRIMQASETLDEIAQLYRVSMTELLRVNRVAEDAVQPGALLYIPIHA